MTNTHLDRKEPECPKSVAPVDAAKVSKLEVDGDVPNKKAAYLNRRMWNYMRECDGFPVDSIDDFCCFAAFTDLVAEVKNSKTEKDLTERSAAIELQKALQQQLATALRTALKDNGRCIAPPHPIRIPWFFLELPGPVWLAVAHRAELRIGFGRYSGVAYDMVSVFLQTSRLSLAAIV